MQTRKVANNDIYRRDDEKGGSGSPRPPSVSSFRSSNTGTGKSSRKTASVAGSRMGSSQGPNSAQQDPTGQIIELGDDDDDYAHLESQLLSTLRGVSVDHVSHHNQLLPSFKFGMFYLLIE